MKIPPVLHRLIVVWAALSVTARSGLRGRYLGVYGPSRLCFPPLAMACGLDGLRAAVEIAHGDFVHRTIDKFNKTGELSYCRRGPIYATVSPLGDSDESPGNSRAQKRRRPAMLEHHRAHDPSQLRSR